MENTFYSPNGPFIDSIKLSLKSWNEENEYIAIELGSAGKIHPKFNI
jgi:hypothetical protein